MPSEVTAVTANASTANGGPGAGGRCEFSASFTPVNGTVRAVSAPETNNEHGAASATKPARPSKSPKTGSRSKPAASKPKPSAPPDSDGERRPIKMLHDRLLVRLPNDGSERRTSGGILIPATAQQNKRLVWGEVIGAGPNVRTAQEGDRVLFSPEDRHEVEVHGDDFLILRERDVHAIAAPRIEPGSTGLYL